jgi:hypothetical protein
VSIKFGLGNNKLIFDVKDGASLFISSDVEFVHLSEILGDVNRFLWELKFAAGVRDDEPVLLFIEFVGAQFESGVCSDFPIVDVNIG